MARFTPTFKTPNYTGLMPSGVQLPPWFYNVPATDFSSSLTNGMKVVENIDDLSNKLDNSRKRDRIEEEIQQTPDEELSYDGLLKNLKKIYKEEGDAAGLIGIMENEAKTALERRKEEEADRKSKQPRLYGGADGLIEYDPVTKKTTRLYDKPDKPGKGDSKTPKFEVPYFNPETLAETKVNELDPVEVDIARKRGYKPGKPSMWDELGMPNPNKTQTALEEKQQAETQSRAITPETTKAPSWLDRQLAALDKATENAYNSATQSMQKRKLTAPRRQ